MKDLKVSQRAKIYLRTLGLLVALIALGIGVFKLGTAQIPAQKNRLSAQIRKEQILNQKAELLRSLSSEITNQADFTSFALPSQNSSFAAISQINKLAQENVVFLTNLRIGTEVKDGSVSSSDVSFDVEGQVQAILNFLKGLSTVAPITHLDKIEINQTQETSRGTVRAKVFWAEIPKTLPAISEPLSDLTSEEREILIKVMGLSTPDFVTLEPQAERENPNPF